MLNLKKKKWYKQAYLQNRNKVRDARRFFLHSLFEDARDCVTKNAGAGSLGKVRVASR